MLNDRPYPDDKASLQPRTREAAAAELIDRQTQHRALELAIEQVRSELHSLAGASGLIYGLFGQKQSRLETAQQQLNDLQQRQRECHTALLSLEREVAELTRMTASAEPPPRQTLPISSPSAETMQTSQLPAAAQTAIDQVERVIESGREALRDFHEECETLSMAGRVRFFQHHKLMRAAMKVARGRNADDCAIRVRTSVQRFARQISTILGSTDIDAQLLSLSTDLQQLATEIEGTWLRSDSGSLGGERLQERLQTADMLLERKLADMRTAATSS